ncbi:MAG: hypothetical protein WAN03_01580 [Candidatus Sulfotelmatobacter sp.]
MKFPQSLCVLLAVSMMAVLSACGGGSSNGSPGQRIPPPPPTGTNYTTCNGQQVPNWQSNLFISNYQNAIQAMVQKYGSDSRIGYIRIGLGRGGEINLPQGWNDSSTGACYGGYSGKWNYTVGGSTSSSSSWNSYLSTMVTYEAGLGHSHPLLVSITPVNGAGTATDDFIAGVATQHGVSFGNQGLESSDISGFPNGCGGDWCNLFAQYNPQIAELQTLGQSCPAGTACVNNLASSTGPLPPLLSFATLHGSNDLEIYYEDWLIAYDLTYANSVGAGSSQPAYQAAIQAARAAGAKVQVLFPPQSGDTDYPAVQQYLMSNPDVDGVLISVEWSDFDLGSNGAHSSYDFSPTSITEMGILPWVSAGKTVNLVLQDTTYGGSGNCPNGGIGSNGNVGNNCAMPAWMWTVLQ